MSDNPKDGGAPPNVHLWSRDGFLGANAIAIRPAYTPTYRSVVGAHAPHRFNIFDIATDDSVDPQALPTEVMVARDGVRISVSARKEAMQFTVRNAEADELHFLQTGKCRFLTDFGVLEAGPQDFVCIPRSVSYRLEPLSSDLREVILESPEPLRFDTPAPFGMINFGASVRRCAIDPSAGGSQRSASHTLLIKCVDGVTRFEMEADPIPAVAHVGGTAPVWALNLTKIVPIAYGTVGGPPAQFLSTATTGIMLYTLSARPGGRPPIHHNADYDELVLYAAGPGAWGGVSEPGTLTWVPKGVTHHGPVENVPAGYLAWLLEARSTFRLTPAAKSHAALMETRDYGYQTPR